MHAYSRLGVINQIQPPKNVLLIISKDNTVAQPLVHKRKQLKVPPNQSDNPDLL